MADREACVECGAKSLFVSPAAAANGGQGPELLRGLGGWLSRAKMRVVVCKACGLMRLYAEDEACDRLGNPNGWKPI
jgi:hypothetical protein